MLLCSTTPQVEFAQDNDLIQAVVKTSFLLKSNSTLFQQNREKRVTVIILFQKKENKESNGKLMLSFLKNTTN